MKEYFQFTSSIYLRSTELSFWEFTLLRLEGTGFFWLWSSTSLVKPCCQQLWGVWDFSPNFPASKRGNQSVKCHISSPSPSSPGILDTPVRWVGAVETRPTHANKDVSTVKKKRERQGFKKRNGTSKTNFTLDKWNHFLANNVLFQIC